jgi:hypothetical protein
MIEEKVYELFDNYKDEKENELLYGIREIRKVLLYEMKLYANENIDPHLKPSILRKMIDFQQAYFVLLGALLYKTDEKIGSRYIDLATDLEKYFKD